MKLKKQIINFSIALSSLLVSSAAVSHSSYLMNPATGEKEFSENSSHYLKLSLNHTCSKPDGESADILHAGVLLPNANAVITEFEMMESGEPEADAEGTALSDLTSVLAIKDKDGATHGANAVMSIKPVLDANWNNISINKGTVPEFYNHGAKTEDVRAIHFLNARNPLDPNKIGLPNDFVTSLQFKAKVGELQGCVAKVRVHTPSADYCDGGIVKVWTKENTAVLSEEFLAGSNGSADISSGYAPYFDIVRSESNPMDSSCGMGKMVTIYPSGDDIDEQLGQWAPQWAGAHDNGDQNSDEPQCPEGQHFMSDTGMCMDNGAMM